MGANLSSDLKPLIAKVDEILASMKSMHEEISTLSAIVGALQQEVAAQRPARESYGGQIQPRGAQRTRNQR